MEAVHQLFLDALRAAIAGGRVTWAVGEISAEEYSALTALSAEQLVLPIIYDAIYNCKSVQALPQKLTAPVRKAALTMVIEQAQRAVRFSRLYSQLKEKGLEPIVVKGLVCRALYPHPDGRLSTDEDLLISPGQFADYRDALEDCGMILKENEEETAVLHEVTYYAADHPTFQIELHKTLFEQSSEVYGQLNELFATAFERSVQLELDGVVYRTMCPYDHLLFLILHAYKHFLHSGFGLRQLCDICIYSRYWTAEIDWMALKTSLQELKLHRFVSALYGIGRDYLGIHPEEFLPEGWLVENENTEALLLDLLGAGVFGSSTMSRKHSSNMTLDAVAANNAGKIVIAQGGPDFARMMKSAFPAPSRLTTRYPYLRKHPYLAPIAWADRLLKYSRETADAGSENSAAEALKIGSERIELLRKYGIID